MSDIVKWGLLVAGALALIALVVALPFNQYIDIGEFGAAISAIVTKCGTAFTAARGLVNNFLSPFGRTALTGLLIYLFARWLLTMGIKTGAWVYHFIFK